MWGYRSTIRHLKSSLRRTKIKRSIQSIKPYCQSDARIIGQIFEKYGFHYSLVVHPCSLFSVYGNCCITRSTKRFERELKRFKTLIETGPFRGSKDLKMLYGLGINVFFAEDLSRVLSDGRKPTVYDIPYRDLTNERIVVYTALTGDYDYIHEILYKQPNVDYLLFTNNKSLESATWEVKYVESNLDNLLLSRKIKMFPHKYLPQGYTSSIYIDANALIYGDISELCCYLVAETTMAVTTHYARNSIKDEINACVECGRIEDDVEALAQYEGYLKEGFRDDMGLAECTILIRKHNDFELQLLMEEWWKEFCSGAKRDQFSLLPSVYRLSFKGLKMVPGVVWFNQFAIIGGHK